MLGSKPLAQRETDDDAADAVWQADLIRIALRQEFEARSIDAELVADLSSDSQRVHTHEERHRCLDRKLTRASPNHVVSTSDKASRTTSKFVPSDHVAA